MDAPVILATEFGASTDILLTIILVLCAVAIVAYLVKLARRSDDDDPDN